jgi:ABC-type transport system substrate-binding protein
VNPEVDAALHATSKTLDRAVQVPQFWKAQQIIADECPTFPIVQNVDLMPINVDLKNFRPSPVSGPFDFMMDTDI